MAEDLKKLKISINVQTYKGYNGVFKAEMALGVPAKEVLRDAFKELTTLASLIGVDAREFFQDESQTAQ